MCSPAAFLSNLTSPDRSHPSRGTFHLRGSLTLGVFAHSHKTSSALRFNLGVIRLQVPAHRTRAGHQTREDEQMPRSPTAVDQHVGARMRAARLDAGKSQTEVADALGITFQQVQKYEKGTNRISAGTLHELSRFFDTPVQFFFDGMDGAVRRGNSKGAAALDPLTRFGTTSDGMKIVTAFDKADPSLHRILAQHVTEMVRAARRKKR
jgi:transcriptional regulator with XRE-family HTH domain